MKIIDKDTELRIHGHDPIGEILVPDEKIIDFATFIEELEIEKRKYFLGPANKKESILEGQNFFNRHFKLHKVPYKNELRCDIDRFILKHLPGIKIPLKIHNIARNIHPFNLPVRYTGSDLIECMVVENVTYIATDYFIDNMKLSFKEIVLPPQITELTASSYVHEVTHTQLAHVKGIIRDYYNSEILSIFLEILCVYESSKQETLLPLQDAMRLTELYQELYTLEEHNKGIKKVEQSELIDSTKYSTSIIKAYNLFVEYYYGTPALRKYILTCIQNILDGNLQLEELLDEFEITIHSSLDNPKLTRYFLR